MKTILIVDDEPRIAEIARDYLENAGFRVATAGNGADALARIRASRPDLVVLDLALPGMDGLDVARAVRRNSNVPIIMLTARVDETDRVAGLELDLVLDVPRMKVTVNGRAIDVTPTEFQLLATLIRHPGRVFTRAQLLDAIRGVANESFERAIDAHVKNLRRKIEDDPRNPKRVVTVYGIGYKCAD